jgi:hypothetical protein
VHSERGKIVNFHKWLAQINQDMNTKIEKFKINRLVFICFAGPSCDTGVAKCTGLREEENKKKQPLTFILIASLKLILRPCCTDETEYWHIQRVKTIALLLCELSKVTK